jgi:hypothetical protein
VVGVVAGVVAGVVETAMMEEREIRPDATS